MDSLLPFLYLSTFFLRSASSGSFGRGRSIVTELFIRSVPRFDVNLTGGAGGFSSSEDMVAAKRILVRCQEKNSLGAPAMRQPQYWLAIPLCGGMNGIFTSNTVEYVEFRHTYRKRLITRAVYVVIDAACIADFQKKTILIERYRLLRPPFLSDLVSLR